MMNQKNEATTDRIAMLEKLLKFSNLEEGRMEKHELENYCMQYVDDTFKPSQKRILEM